MIGYPVKLGVNVLQNREEKHFLGFVEFIERALCNADRLRQLLYGGFLHPQRDSTMSRFLQQRLAELLGLVIGKSQARASFNMTGLVLLVILYRISFRFARGAGKNHIFKIIEGYKLSWGMILLAFVSNICVACVVLNARAAMPFGKSMKLRE